jgi:hypothetical protein
MHILELIRNGGALAMAAVAAGLFGTLLGVIGLIGPKNKSAVGLAAVTVLLGVGAATFGMLGTVWGKSRTDAALGNVSRVDRERIRPIGYQEAQDASLVGFGASLLPLLLGAVVILGARAKSSSAPPVVSLLAQPKSDEASGVNTIALGFLGIGVLLSAGAFMMSRLPLPVGELGLAPDDDDGWALASALEDVREDPNRGCSRLDQALRKYRDPSLREPPAALAWKAEATRCVDGWVKGEPQMPLLSYEALLDSPMVHDANSKAKVLAWREQHADDTAGPDEFIPKSMIDLPQPDRGAPSPPELDPAKPGTRLAASDIAPVVRKAMPKVKQCYERGLRTNPTLAGKITVQFTITAKGNVASVTDISAPPFAHGPTAACVLERFKALKFPPHDGEPTIVKYPVVFSNGG